MRPHRLWIAEYQNRGIQNSRNIRTSKRQNIEISQSASIEILHVGIPIYIQECPASQNRELPKTDAPTSRRACASGYQVVEIAKISKFGNIEMSESRNIVLRGIRMIRRYNILTSPQCGQGPSSPTYQYSRGWDRRWSELSKPGIIPLWGNGDNPPTGVSGGLYLSKGGLRDFRPNANDPFITFFYRGHFRGFFCYKILMYQEKIRV